MLYLYTALGMAGWLIVHHIARYGLKLEPIRLSPDGQQYMAMARGEQIKSPYGLRWALPWLCGRWRARWHAIVWAVTTWAALAALGPLMIYYLPADTTRPATLLSPVLVAGLPGVFRVNVILPILADGPGLALMLLSAGLCRQGYMPAGVAVAGLGSTVRETVPIFAAAACWSWYPLLGLAPVLVQAWRLRSREAKLYESGFFTRVGRAMVDGKRGWFPGLNGQGHRLLQGVEMLLPWGVCLCVAGSMDWQLAVALGLGYLQLAHGNDRSRLYQWAFPPVVWRASEMLGRQPRWMAGPLVLVHLFHPWNDKCV